MRPSFSRLHAPVPLMIVLVAGGIGPISAWAATPPSLDQLLGYSYVSGLVASGDGDRFAWVEDVRGVRNLWCASAGDRSPRQLTHYSADDGQELTQLTFSTDGSQLLFVRGGDHDENWPAKGNLAPNPSSSPLEPKVTIWSIATTAATSSPQEIAEGDSPALSAKGQLAYIKDGQIWTAPLTPASGAAGKPQRLLFDRGQDDTPVWSPDGTRLAFVSGRDDHSFIGVYTSAEQPLLYVAPSTNFDEDPVWSPDGRSIAFLRQPSHGETKENFLVERPHPFAVWTADAATGKGQPVWSSPNSLPGSLPDLAEAEPLFWMADNQLVFLTEMDNWPHLYSIAVKGGTLRKLTQGNFMVENVTQSPDRQALIYSANTGDTAGDDDRRHLFRVDTGGHVEQLTRGDGLEWSPAALMGGAVAYISAGAQRPAATAISAPDGAAHVLDTGATRDYPASALAIPRLVSFKAPDGLTIQAQLFRSADAPAHQPGVIFVHGGPPRQMLLGWHYMDYYSNAYATNQYLATHGFTVLSVNYRLGIGYGRAFQHPEHAGPAGAAEYQDVLAGARYLQQTPGVDAHRIGIWGGSYGGYLTGLALARNSDVFKAGADFHGISNWIPQLAKEGVIPQQWYEVNAEWQKAVATALAASPNADLATWKSPVLLIQGDDDRNVPFDQTVDLAYRLKEQQTPVEELVIPNEIHGFLRRSDWLRADEATVEFLRRQLIGPR